jgi:hypothetical protein
LFIFGKEKHCFYFKIILQSNKILDGASHKTSSFVALKRNTKLKALGISSSFVTVGLYPGIKVVC